MKNYKITFISWIAMIAMFIICLLTSCSSFIDSIVYEPIGIVREIDHENGFAIICFDNSRSKNFDCKAYELSMLDSLYLGKEIRLR
jgi:hypothetical protein